MVDGIVHQYIEVEALAVLVAFRVELVLQYLMDGNVPVTLTPVNEEKASNDVQGIHSLASQIFPVALKPARYLYAAHSHKF